MPEANMGTEFHKRERPIVGFIWRFLERFGAQLVTFIVSIVLARRLEPTAYGIVALVSVFTVIVQTFVDSGLGTALVQKKDSDDLDFSSVFYFNLFFCALLYVCIFLAAPVIAAYYNLIELKRLIRVLSITILISGIKNIQQAYVSKHMMFKKFFFSTLAGTIVASFVGIYLAYSGYGVWALVFQNLANKCIDTIVLWITVQWRPKLCFSFQRLKELWRYGWKILAAALIDRIYKQIRILIIGKHYSSTDLAFYNRGEQYPGLIIDNIDVSIDSVLLPSLALAQDNLESVKNLTRIALQVGSYILTPMLMGLAVCAKPIVSLMLTEKWLPCVPYLQVFCFCYALRPLNTANLNAIKAIGRSDVYLRLDIIKKLVGILIVILTARISVFAMALGLAASGIIAMLINMWPNQKLLNYTITVQIMDIAHPAIISSIMGLLVWIVTLLHLSDALTLIIQIPLGVLIYLAASILIKPQGYLYTIGKARNLIHRK